MASARTLTEVLEILDTHQRSVKTRRPLWEGTFDEFLGLVFENPRLAENAHQRLYRILVEEPGVEEIFMKDRPKLRRALGLDEDDILFIPKAFSGNFYGLEMSLHDLVVKYLKPANEFGEAFLQALAFIGPIGGGKSSIVEKIKFRLEQETFFAIKDCPVFDNPLWALPRSERVKLSEALGVAINFGREELAPDICLVCRWRLHKEFGNDYRKFRVIEQRFSKRDKVGIATIFPNEIDSADPSQIIGSSDVSQWDEHHEADPSVIKLDGLADRANRGVLEHVEGFEFPKSFLNHLITCTQERRIDAPTRQGQISVDFVPIIHSNEEKMDEFFAHPENLKFYDRCVPIFVPYNLRIDEEQRIYRKLTKRSKFETLHTDPHAVYLASLFAVMTRLLPSEIHPDIINKARVFNGEEVEAKGQAKPPTVNEFLNEYPTEREGMSGVGVRFITKAIDTAFAYNALQHIQCLTTIGLLKSLERAVRSDAIIPRDEETLGRYIGYLKNQILAHYKARVEDHLLSAFVIIKEDETEGIFQKYLDQAELAFRGQPADQVILRTIEDYLGKGAGSITPFRHDLLVYVEECRAQKKPVRWNDYKPIKEVVEKILKVSMFGLLRLPQSERLRRPKDEALYGRWIETLVGGYRYCKDCAARTLDWASDNLS